MSHSVISIHAPTRGATIDVLLNSASAQFQSTLPRGERHITGATTCSRLNFNPRSHEGSDMIAPYDWQLLQVFQSTLPRGERHKRPLFFVCEANFNPRSHEGSDQTLSSVRCSPQISIHAPTRGATDNIIDEQRDELFQSTLPRGERP